MLVVKNPPAKVGKTRDMGLIPGPGRSLGARHSHPLQCPAWRVPWTEEPGGCSPWVTESDTTERSIRNGPVWNLRWFRGTCRVSSTQFEFIFLLVEALAWGWMMNEWVRTHLCPHSLQLCPMGTSDQPPGWCSARSEVLTSLVHPRGTRTALFSSWRCLPAAWASWSLRACLPLPAPCSPAAAALLWELGVCGAPPGPGSPCMILLGQAFLAFLKLWPNFCMPHTSKWPLSPQNKSFNWSK